MVWLIFIAYVTIGTICFFAFKIEKRNVMCMYILGTITVLLSVFVLIYYSPSRVKLPDNPVIQYRIGNSSVAAADTDEVKSDIIDTLQKLKLQRTANIGDWPTTPIHMNDWLYIWVSDGNQIRDGLPVRVLEFIFILSKPEESVLNNIEEGAFGRYKIYNAAVVLKELAELP